MSSLVRVLPVDSEASKPWVQYVEQSRKQSSQVIQLLSSLGCRIQRTSQQSLPASTASMLVPENSHPESKQVGVQTPEIDWKNWVYQTRNQMTQGKDLQSATLSVSINAMYQGIPVSKIGFLQTLRQKVEAELASNPMQGPNAIDRKIEAKAREIQAAVDAFIEQCAQENVDYMTLSSTVEGLSDRTLRKLAMSYEPDRVVAEQIRSLAERIVHGNN